MSRPLRWGVLGAARITDDALVRPARTLGHRLAVVGASDRGRAARFAHRLGIDRVVDGYADVVRAPDVDAVYVPLVNGLHVPWVLAAVEAGKHVLCEKPLALDAEGARTVRDAARGTGLVVAEAFHHAAHPVVVEALDVVRRGELGRVEHVGARACIPAPPPGDGRWEPGLGGGALMDVGCYALLAVRAVAAAAGLGPVEVVRAHRRERHGVDVVTRAELTLGDASADVTASMDADDVEFTLVVRGSAGVLEVPCFVLPHLDPRLVVTTAAGVDVRVLDPAPSYEHQLRAFAAAVAGEGAVPVDLAESVATAELLDATVHAGSVVPG